MAASLRLVSEEEADSGSMISGRDATERLATFHREVAAKLPVGSGVRATALRCAGHWDHLGALDESEEN